MPRQARHLRLHPIRQAIAVGRGDVQVQAQHHRGLRQRGRDVVAVADVRDGASLQPAESLLQSEHVGHGLTWVFLVGQRIDHVEARRGSGELLENLLRERADDHRIHPALEIARDVGGRLASAQRHIRRNQNRIPAELADRDLEGHPRAQRRLVEEQRDVASR